MSLSWPETSLKTSTNRDLSLGLLGSTPFRLGRKGFGRAEVWHSGDDLDVLA